METVCDICKKTLTDARGCRVASGTWDSSIGLGALCDDCYGCVSAYKKAGDALLTTAIWVEEFSIPACPYLKFLGNEEELQKVGERFYADALSIYTLCFERSNLFRNK